jgi:hypothetical protein
LRKLFGRIKKTLRPPLCFEIYAEDDPRRDLQSVGLQFMWLNKEGLAALDLPGKEYHGYAFGQNISRDGLKQARRALRRLGWRHLPAYLTITGSIGASRLRPSTARKAIAFFAIVCSLLTAVLVEEARMYLIQQWTVGVIVDHKSALRGPVVYTVKDGVSGRTSKSYSFWSSGLPVGSTTAYTHDLLGLAILPGFEVGTLLLPTFWLVLMGGGLMSLVRSYVRNMRSRKMRSFETNGVKTGT